MKKNRFITGYSGLRALAVIGVILYHLDPNSFMGGYLGVPIFFVLSGYLVTDHMMNSYVQTGSYDNKHFYLSRIKRLYPQLITVLWLSAAYIFVFQRNLLAKLNQIVLANLLNVYNFWQIGNGQSYFERFASNESPFTNLWTMSIEGQFYIVWPIIIYLLVKLVRKKKNIFWILFGLSLASAIEMAVLYLLRFDINRIYYGTDTRFFSLGLGAVLALIWPIAQLNPHVRKKDTLILDIMGLVSFVIMMMLFFSKAMDPQRSFAYCGGMLLFTLDICILAGVIAHPGSHWNRILTNKLFDWIGSRSYGIYLYQFPVMIFFEDKVNIGDHPNAYHIIEIILILLITEITYRLIEKPMSKTSWSKTKAYFARIFDWDATDYAKKIQAFIAFLILIVGSAAIVVAPRVKAEDFNKSQLAERINQNTKKQKTDNAKLIKKLKKQKQKKEDKSKAIQEATKQATQHPVNKSYVKYGISQLDLQLAQKVQVTAIGDSVMAGSSSNLKQLMPKALIDAAVSRQLNVAFGLLDNYKSQGVLADNVLIGLGTNGPFSMDDLNKIMYAVGPRRKVFWVNVHVPTRDWQNSVNSLIKQGAKRYHNLIVIDWYSYSKNHPKWFYGDHTHPNLIGSKYYSALITKTIVKHSKF
ncbi:acyltransferase family protein [Lactobacillus kefiranofaciens]|nr:acyltransferase family protein [Lactobacillus kefiranofaciens]KRL24468.1 acyltransferase [Lactobacillus kefiranofaciens subsp. kefirgranum DSM 10550 = JCM 8572]MCJ2172126.1 acetyltransferase [Lactobacillus kefiranofaciens]MCP9329915.1 acetyltransferase [Lactobacillus kefiranofaciens]MDF4142128.1 acyltransferase family protein [Lactobacillus kefiranofaciens]QNT43390.1 acetyltransferase [Lactobacillus kefiranofaciens]